MDVKISELTALAAPVETDVLAIVNGSETKKVAVNKLITTYFPAEPVWDDIRVPVTATKAGGSKDPGFEKLKDNGSGSQGVFTYMFSPTAEEELYFSVQVPHNYKYGTNFHPHVHWAPTTTNTGDVVWGLEYTLAEISGTLGNTTIIYGTDAGDGTAYKHQLVDLTEIDGSAIDSVSMMMICRVFRNAAATEDTYTGDAALLEIDFHYEIDSLGSDTEYAK